MTRLSIIVCTRNRAQSLEPMISAMKAIRSEQDWELLLVDNASTDNTRERLTFLAEGAGNFRIVTASRIGLGAARDMAWREARGDIILFTDDDCYVAPDIVDATIAVFDAHPEIGFAGGRILLHDPDDYPVTIDERTQASDIPAFEFVRPGALQGANMAFRRNALERIGGVDPALGAGTPFPCEDIDTVAACVWAGLPGRFDPSMVVRHHHGRKASDYPALMASYDRGRGAYFAKHLLCRKSRIAYLQGWIAGTFRDLHRGRLSTLARELAAAKAYMIHRRAWATLIAMAPLAGAVYVTLAGAITINKAALTIRK
ncbi:glycosyltransferase family 2 protein [Novosphingobium sp. CECT 9465]|uniref:glycosyltransferase family 2 protein n=1 Tax=Novosphingobium sp. CECT 9465 TaxID=2829794 RepID=UPI001E46764B|nr:glycosyltransferase family A protein [Novosphingobium sp. CECT 9465]CAH0495463.1 hypothetical protein NVSP9465_00469 [Novosphingobium sp. CECT 9465]